MYRMIEKWVKQFASTISEFNAARTALRSSGLLPHLAATTAVGTADATNTATAVTLVNAIKAAYNAHIASTTYHAAADATNAASSSDATNEATGITLANELKGDFNAHIVLTAAHGAVGGAGSFTPATVTTTDASDEATLVALANALKAAVNRHFAAGFAAASESD